ncbi:hypothetical protein [Psychrobacillus sp. FSL K6-4046]|uniref:hypothetical protein n=1 Tax=Psychrobacillus sp. FSL K6-4046 TaxID=2921550 RepID=UPI002638A519|nr:hypothetical protein [uncultured Psychrobacillus sp.]
MALFLGLLSMLFGSLFMSLTVDELGSIGNLFLLIYGIGLFLLGALVLGSRKKKRVRKPMNIKRTGISLAVLGLILLFGSYIQKNIPLVYLGSILLIAGVIFMLTKLEEVQLNVKPIVICIYMITFGMVMVITTFLGLPNEDLRTFGFVQLMLGIIFAVLESVKEIKPPAKQMSFKAK